MMMSGNWAAEGAAPVFMPEGCSACGGQFTDNAWAGCGGWDGQFQVDQSAGAWDSSAYAAEEDSITEQQLDLWVQAKRARDFDLADSIRKELRDKGVDPDTARPGNHPSPQAMWGMYSSGKGKAGAVEMRPPHIEEKLDRWVEAKRKRKFAEADSIRDELRQSGIDPDKARPGDIEHSFAAKGMLKGDGGAPVLKGKGKGPNFNMQRMFDPWIEGKLDRWVEAKLNQDYALADEIRNEIRALGINPDDARPARLASDAAFPAPKAALDADTQRQLDLWVEAKRAKDFATADAIRVQLRAIGVDPDTERPIGPPAKRPRM
eukprot:TRINITY_DN37436_c0_g1_i1.p1 TRINITY_DN37436_c0_g1~~TRINITY_DN37436_c0_g1_i1.p1  ORF type:complete len:342 (-),score=67.58 TRINITY_DN37436_c0_g1_i1:103-1059(-)